MTAFRHLLSIGYQNSQLRNTPASVMQPVSHGGHAMLRLAAYSMAKKLPLASANTVDLTLWLVSQTKQARCLRYEPKSTAFLASAFQATFGQRHPDYPSPASSG